MAKRIGNFRS